MRVNFGSHAFLTYFSSFIGRSQRSVVVCQTQGLHQLCGLLRGEEQTADVRESGPSQDQGNDYDATDGHLRHVRLLHETHHPQAM